MKTKQFFNTSWLLLITLVSAFTISTVSCSKDEDVDDVGQLNGTWKREYTDENGKTLTDTFWFDSSSKRGEYRPAEGWNATFIYDIKTPGVLHLKMTYYRYDFVGQYLSYKSEENWSCHKKGDRLWIDGKEYRRM